jgi:hypothetical protein
LSAPYKCVVAKLRSKAGNRTYTRNFLSGKKEGEGERETEKDGRDREIDGRNRKIEVRDMEIDGRNRKTEW